MIEAAPIAMRYPRCNLAACMLPWTADWELDVAAFTEHVNTFLQAGYRNLYVMGTAGEGYALSDRRFQQVVQTFAELTVGEGLDPQVGVIALSMEQITERVACAYHYGIRMFQISLPSWGPLDESETMLFFKSVCGAFPDCRFLHYNLPRVGRIIGGAEYRRIADTVPNLVATKNSSTDYARTVDLLKHTPDLQHFLLESNFAMGCSIGECSLLCSQAGLFPETTWRLFQAGLDDDLPELFRITALLHGVTRRLFAHCQRRMIDGCYDKTFLWLRDPQFPTRMLPPYLGLSDEERQTCRAVFDAEFRQIP